MLLRCKVVLLGVSGSCRLMVDAHEHSEIRLVYGVQCCSIAR